MVKPIGKGAVLPAGAIPASGKLPKGELAVEVTGVDDSGLLRCVYPDGFVKHHQAKDAGELLPQLIAQMRGRYGVNVTFPTAPASLKKGTKISMEAS